MGTLASSVFTAMMGWIRTVALEIWNTFSSPEGTTAMGWIGAHWKGLAIGLCTVGMVIDLIVYLFRWQPYRIWRSRRSRRREADAAEEMVQNDEEEMGFSAESMQAGEIPLTVAAAELAPSLIRQAGMDGSTEVETWPGTEARQERTAPRRGGRRSSVARYVESSYSSEAEDEIRAARREGYRLEHRADGGYGSTALAENARTMSEAPDALAEQEPAGRTTEKFEQAIRPRRRMRNMLRDAQELETETPDQLIDRNEAYRRPVYPRGWNEKERDNP